MNSARARHFKELRAHALARLQALQQPTASCSDIPAAIRDAARKFKLETRVSDDNYGQGIASFVDAWFYKPTPAFRPAKTVTAGAHFVGLYVLFCKIAPYYLMGEGEKIWSGRGRSSYLPSFIGTDVLQHEGPRQIATVLDDFFASRGFVRLLKADVAAELPSELQIQSNLIDDVPRLFDALFFWND